MILKKSIRFGSSLLGVLLLFLVSGCSMPTKQSDQRINMNSYKNNKVDVFAYHPNMIEKLEKQIEIDNSYVRAHRDQIIRFEEIKSR